LARCVEVAAAVSVLIFMTPQFACAQTSSSPTTSPDTSAASAVNEPYNPTLNFGTGLIDDPVAWISPNNSDFWLTYGARRIPSTPNPTGGAFSYLNGNIALDTHWLQRFDVGVSIYSNNPEWGFFGQVLAIKENQFADGVPAVAFGFRNLGPFPHEERFLIGTDVTVDSNGHSHEFTPPYFKHFNTVPTLYGVATKNFAINTSWLSGVGVSLGLGDGIFSQDGNLGAAYSNSGTVARGLFFGARTVSHPSANTTISVIAENNGFDWNAGVVGGWRGLMLGLYGSELGKGTTRSPSSFYIYNYAKFDFAVSYNGNFIGVAHGQFLRLQITEIQREQTMLRKEIGQHNQTIAKLESELAKLQQAEFTDSAKQKAQLEQELQQERDAIKRANDRLKQLQGGNPQ
jgi:hypothetical protein